MIYEITEAVPHPDHTVTVTWSDGERASENMRVEDLLSKPQAGIGEATSALLMRSSIFALPSALDGLVLSEAVSDALIKKNAHRKVGVTDPDVRLLFTPRETPNHQLTECAYAAIFVVLRARHASHKV